MNEEELEILDECMSVVAYVNMRMKTEYALEQLDATAYKFRITEAGKAVYHGTLKECDQALIGMLVLTKTLQGRE